MGKRVVVPQHTRVGKTGKQENVDTYTYERRDSVGGGLAAKTSIAGRFSNMADVRSSMGRPSGDADSGTQKLLEQGHAIHDAKAAAWAHSKLSSLHPHDQEFWRKQAESKGIDITKPEGAKWLRKQMDAGTSEHPNRLRKAGEKKHLFHLSEAGMSAVDRLEVALAASYTPEKRDALQKKGHAFKNGNGESSYPIPDVEHLKAAIQAFGRAKPEDKARLKAFIMKRARALGHPELIPDSWTGKVAASAVDGMEVKLARVTVPQHTRRNRKTGKQEDVETYTYERHDKSGIGGALKGLFHKVAGEGAAGRAAADAAYGAKLRETDRSERSNLRDAPHVDWTMRPNATQMYGDPKMGITFPDDIVEHESDIGYVQGNDKLKYDAVYSPKALNMAAGRLKTFQQLGKFDTVAEAKRAVEVHHHRYAQDPDRDKPQSFKDALAAIRNAPDLTGLYPNSPAAKPTRGNTATNRYARSFPDDAGDPKGYARANAYMGSRTKRKGGSR